MRQILLATTALSLCLALSACNDDKGGTDNSSTFEQLNTRITAQDQEIARLKQAHLDEKAAFEAQLTSVKQQADAWQAINYDFDALKQKIEAGATLTPDELKHFESGLTTLETLKDTLAGLRKDFDGKPALGPESVDPLRERLEKLEKELTARLSDLQVDWTYETPHGQALVRLLPKHYDQIKLIKTAKSAADTFQIYGQEGAIFIKGSTPATILTGLNEYLHQVAHVTIGWPGDSLDKLPEKLPAPATVITRSATGKNRYALNDTDDGYSDAYKTWPEWERKIDLLAMHGINQVFMQVGMEEVYRETFRDFGYSDEEIRAWIPAPAHQPWWLLGNMAGIGSPVSPSLFEKRIKMGQRIANRLRELGITPVFPGYYGLVPTEFSKKNPGANLIPQGSFGGENGGTAYVRPDWIDTRTDLYAKIAKVFYEKQKALFGMTHMFKMDLFHEGGTRGTVPVVAAAQGVRDAMLQAAPDGVWVMIGWDSNPLKDVVQVMLRHQVLIVDGKSDLVTPASDRDADWVTRPWAFGTIHNYGGRSIIGAQSSEWFSRYFSVRTKNGGAMDGISWLPEATGVEPAGFELFTDLPWREKAFDFPNWFREYSTRRYGGSDENAAAAWTILCRTAYSVKPGLAQWTGKLHDTLFGATPDLDQLGAWSKVPASYDLVDFAMALPKLLEVRPELRTTSAYQYDLVNVTRQVVSNQSRILLPKIKEAYKNKDKTKFKLLTAVWLEYMQDLDTFLATNREFMLGTFLKNAEAVAEDDKERAKLLFDQRSLLSSWSGNTGLENYASREYSGLIRGLHMPRWRAYFDSLTAALDTGAAPTKVDFFKMGVDWAQRDEHVTTVPSSANAYQLAVTIMEKINQEPN